MKNIQFTLIILIALICVSAKKANAALGLKLSQPIIDTTIVNKNTIYVSVEKQPEFPGGIQGFYLYLGQNIRYPATARQNKTQGKVFVSMVIEKDGSITDVQVIRGVSEDLNEEALRVIKNSPKWMPGIQNGKPVRVRYTIPISFSLGS